MIAWQSPANHYYMYPKCAISFAMFMQFPIPKNVISRAIWFLHVLYHTCRRRSRGGHGLPNIGNCHALFRSPHPTQQTCDADHCTWKSECNGLLLISVVCHFFNEYKESYALITEVIPNKTPPTTTPIINTSSVLWSFLRHCVYNEPKRTWEELHAA